MAKLIWIDCEMTGLDPEIDKLLEIAVIFTDNSLEVVGEPIQFVIHQPKDILDNMNAWCVEQHGKSGLTQRVLESTTDVNTAERVIIEQINVLSKQKNTSEKLILAGNTVHMDLLFLRKYMPTLVEQYLHYRIIDVSSIKELVNRWYYSNLDVVETNTVSVSKNKSTNDALPPVYTKTKNSHRALDDIYESLEELKYYKANYFGNFAFTRILQPVALDTKRSQVLCCECGIPIPPNPANMCVNCIQNQVDVTDGIPKQVSLQYCRNCDRYLIPPSSWMRCELESRELLSLCLKKLKGLQKVRLIDASFVWTEPHSRRIKISITIQKEVFAATILQQKFEVEYIVGYQQCPDCTKIMAKNTWKATVQVRQKVDHQRTFLYLEQVIIKHNMHVDTTNIKVVKGGLDFQYGSRNQAIKMVDFLSSIVPIRSKTSEQLISHDIHTSISNYKFTYSVEIVPMCKGDLVCMTKKVAGSLGQISPLVLCIKVGPQLKVMDFRTLQTADISATTFWRAEEIASISSSKSLKEFYVLDVEPVSDDHGRSKYSLADVTVQRMSDVGKNDNEMIVRTHLGNILEYGDTVLGYDLGMSNINNRFFEKLDPSYIPDVILVKKSYADKRKNSRQRKWELKQLNKEVGDDPAAAAQMGAKSASKKSGASATNENDYEMFLRDLEEDAELRQSINIYKSKNINDFMEEDHDESNVGQNDNDLEIPLEELLDNMDINDYDNNVGEEY
ncbi:60S ribosomal export protein NMD3 [Zancudomyces culisetae]|uniref:60S ribosomal export protein NMD3 n=1 Tax=Zancudomyces culisetae TaxID=1213189 RepID=A0A1R1PHT8_ZANCU|nr:60S ribosomal export protein NMD3 [Zancudomyces culisetae]|eukprot:OMH80544.1 60S ribosomal export protein NMD3 [Zancudomyces culisetae]